MVKKLIIWSTMVMKAPRAAIIRRTTPVYFAISSRVGHITFFSSILTSRKKSRSFFIKVGFLLAAFAGLTVAIGLFTSGYMAGPAGVEPTTPGFGVPCSAKLSYGPALPCFSVLGMLPAPFAKFPQLQSLLLATSVFICHIVSPPALRAGKDNYLAWHISQTPG